MSRFVLLFFGFLAVAFYEFSGGADFDPDATRLAAVQARSDQPGLKVETAAPLEEVNETVARASLDLVTFETVADSAPALTPTRADPALRPLPGATGLATTSETATATLQELTALPVAEPTALQPDNSQQTSATLMIAARDNASARAPATNRFAGSLSRASSDAVGASAGLRPSNLRQVNGDRVNLRAGPGTQHDVVDQLPRGAEVEVIGDNGAGWVQLRTLDSGSEGWMADFLLIGG